MRADSCVKCSQLALLLCTAFYFSDSIALQASTAGRENHTESLSLHWKRPGLHQRTSVLDRGNTSIVHGYPDLEQDIKASARKADVRIIVRYTARLGLANQLYCHVTAIALAVRLKAELILSHSAYRSSFEHAYDSSLTQWTLAATDTILDVEHLISFWGRRGLTMHRVSAVLRLSSLMQTYRQQLDL